MATIILQRYWDNGNETVGGLLIGGKRVCYTLEDTYRDEKIKHETRIPAGTYKIVFRQFGSHYEKYKKRFNSIGNNRGMLQITGVSNFTDILIHIGNSRKDTSGCILVGDNATRDGQQWKLLRSTSAYVRIYPIIADLLSENEEVYLEIRDEKFMRPNPEIKHNLI